jgi:hypothetical protein
MDVPALVRDRLDGETVGTRVPLGGEDAVFVTPSRTLVYRGDGLLSDESVAAYPHDAERLDVTDGRRKATLELTYVDDSGSFTVPSDRLEEVLPPTLGGVLRARGVLESDEAVREVYRFSELTLVVADGRVLKHVGGVFWDEEHESYPYADVTGLDAEEGSVATGIVVEVDGRPERVKVPSDEARLVRRTLEEAVLAYQDVGSLAELREKTAPDADEAEDAGDGGAEDGGAETFDEGGIDPLVDEDAAPPMEPDSPNAPETASATASAGDEPPENAGTTRASGTPDSSASAGSEAASADADTGGDAQPADAGEPDDPFVSPSEAEQLGEERGTDAAADADIEAVLDRLDALERTVEAQSERIDRQRATIEKLVEELRRGR